MTAEERDQLRVVLVRTRNLLNIGAAARAMTNFGFGRLRVVEPYEAAFREARSAVDAEQVLRSAEEFASLSEAVEDCALVVGTAEGRQRTTEEPLQRLEAGVEEIRRHLRGGAQVAVLFGSEKRGLSNEELGPCQRVLRIPTEAEQPSMNLGQAVAVVLYEVIRESAAGGGELERAPATAGDRERLVALLAEMLERSEAARRGERALGEEKVQRLVRHMGLTAPDAHEWMGMVRQVLWKLRGGSDSE